MSNGPMRCIARVAVAAGLCALVSALPVPLLHAKELPLEKCRLVRLLGDSIDGFPADSPLTCPLPENTRATIHEKSTVVFCGRKTICGKRHTVLANETGLTIYTLEDTFDVVEPRWEAGDAELLGRRGDRHEPRPKCLRARISNPRGTSLYVVTDPALAGGEIVDVRRLRVQETVFACRKFGPLLLAYHDGRAGLVVANDLQLEPSQVDAGYVERAGPFCKALAWEGTLLRDSFMYVQTAGGIRRIPERARRLDIVHVLSVVGTRKKRAWHEVIAFGQRGYLPPGSLAISPRFIAVTPDSPLTYCPEALKVGEIDCPTTATPLSWIERARKERLPGKLRLHAETLLPIVSIGRKSVKALYMGTVVSIRRGSCLELTDDPMPEMAMLPERACEAVRGKRAGRAGKTHLDLLQGFTDLGVFSTSAEVTGRVLEMARPDTRPGEFIQAHADWFPFARVRPIDVATMLEAGVDVDLVRAAVLGGGAGQGLYEAFEETLAQLKKGSCGAGTSQLEPPGDFEDRLFELAESEGFPEKDREAIGDYLAGGKGVSVDELTTCFLKGCSRSLHSLLLAGAFIEEGLALPARELLFDILADREHAAGLVPATVPALREAIWRAGPSRRGTELLLAICRGELKGSVDTRTQAESCHLAGRSMLELGLTAEAIETVKLLTELGVREPRFLELTARCAVIKEDPQGLKRYVEALAMAGGGCSIYSATVQAVMLQMARAAVANGETAIAYELVRLMHPDTMLKDYVLVLQLLSHPDDFARALTFLKCATGKNAAARKGPEVPLALSFYYTGKCRLATAMGSVLLAEHRLKTLATLAARLEDTFALHKSGKLGRPEAARVLHQLHELLEHAGARSDEFPELSDVLQRSGVCARWWKYRTEGFKLAALARELELSEDNRFAGMLKSYEYEQEAPCVYAAFGAVDAIRERHGNLFGAATKLRADLVDSLNANWKAAQVLWHRMADLALDNFCMDLKNWAEGRDPSWVESLDDLMLPFTPECNAGSRKVVLTTQQREAFDQATDRGRNICRLGGGLGDEDMSEESTWMKVQNLVSSWSNQALHCLVEAEDQGASDEGLLLLMRRYLPALALVDHAQLDSMDINDLPEEVQAALHAIADSSHEVRDSICRATWEKN